jgi:hypothetical protein
MNALTILRDQGLGGLQKAVNSGGFVPTIAGAALLPLLQIATQQQTKQQSD